MFKFQICLKKYVCPAPFNKDVTKWQYNTNCSWKADSLAFSKVFGNIKDLKKEKNNP